MKVITIEWTAIERFKAWWPCHNLPENADLIVAAFADDGDLINYEMCNHADNVVVDLGNANVRLRYVNCPFAPFLDTNAQNDAKERAINQFPQSPILDNWVYV